MIAGNYFGKVFSNDLQYFSVFRYIGQYNPKEISVLRWNVVSEISKLLLNDISAELDGSRQWD